MKPPPKAIIKPIIIPSILKLITDIITVALPMMK